METEIIQSGFNKAAVAQKVTKDDKEFVMVSFPRTKWVMFENTHYYEDFESTQNGENEYYKHIHMIPKYAIWKNRKKVSIALPRIDGHDKPFLYIPRGWTNPMKTGTNKDRLKYALSKEFYIFNINEEFLIDEFAGVYFSQR